MSRKSVSKLPATANRPSQFISDFNSVVDNTIYELPDRTSIVVGRESTEIPEVMFGNSEFEGIPQLVKTVCEKVPLELRKDVFGSFVISGGATTLKMFFDRLNKELFDADNDFFFNYRTKFYHCNGKIEARCSSWISASVISAMTSFDSLQISRTEFNEHGYNLVERKFN